jgi:hypothetical protein
MAIRHFARRGRAATGATTATWGSVTGTLSDQTDLQAELDAKADLAGTETVSGAWTFTNPANVFKGLSLEINDATDTKSVTFSHDGTNLDMVGVGTAALKIQGFTAGMLFQDGAAIAVQDATNTDALTFWCDGTDAVLEGTSVADLDLRGFTNITGTIFRASGNSVRESAGLIVDADTHAGIYLQAGGGGVDEKNWGVDALSTGIFRITTSTDADAAGNTAFQITRSGVTIDDIDIVSGNTVSITGILSIAGDTNIVGALTATSYGGITEANLLDKSATETVSGAYTFTARPKISSTIPRLLFIESDASVDNKRWEFRGSAELFQLRILNDAESVGTSVFNVNRTGTTVDDVAFNAPITATSYGGITEANLVDKSAAETISGGQWSFANTTNFTSGGPRLSNNVFLQARQADTTGRSILGIFTDDTVLLGSPVLALDIRGTAIDVQGSCTISTDIRLNNNIPLVAYEALGTARNILKMDTSDNVLLGAPTSTLYLFSDAAIQTNFGIDRDSTAGISDTFDVGSSASDADVHYRIAGTLTALVRWDAGLNQFHWMDRDPSTVVTMIHDMDDGTLWTLGAISTDGGIDLDDNVELTFGTDSDWVVDFSNASNVLLLNGIANTEFAIAEAGTWKLLLDHSVDHLWLRDGYTFRISETDDSTYLEITHDTNSTDFVVAGTGVSHTFNFSGWNQMDIGGGMDLRIRDAGQLVIFDSTDVDSATMSHDGTDFNLTFAGTTDWNINGNSIVRFLNGQQVHIQDAGVLRIFDTADSDYITMSHDGTNMNFVGTNTNAFEFQGAIIQIDYNSTTPFQVRPDQINAITTSMTSMTHAHVIGMVTDVDTDNIGMQLYAQGGTQNSRSSFFLDGSALETGIANTWSTSGACDFVFYSSTNDRLRYDVSEVALKMHGGLKIQERAAAVADTSGYGQLWVKNTTPCQLWFTDDAGTDTQIV